VYEGQDSHKEEAIIWTIVDEQAVSESRGLALDLLKIAGSGHPGITLSMMPLIYLLYAKILKFNPSDPDWTGRDYFVLSCGHASLAQYIQLHLAGFNLSIDDLRKFRQLDSKTPGHPEYGVTAGVELSSGPLGQGFAMSVGIALANKYHTQLMGNREFFRRNVFVLVSDGDTQEGIFAESASLANLYQLDNLIVFYDSNQITIDGSTALSANVEVKTRMESHGWDVQVIKPKPSGDLDPTAVWKATLKAMKTNQPSLIVLESTIGWPAPDSKGTSKIHGNLLSTEELDKTQELLKYFEKEELGFSASIIESAVARIEKKQKYCAEFDRNRLEWFSKNSHKLEIWKEMQAKTHLSETQVPRLPEGIEKISTRKMNGEILKEIKANRFGCIGGSADLTESNSLSLENLFLETVNVEVPGDNFTFGVREHAMSAIINGFALAGQTIPYCATYLVFSDYQKPAIRMAALMDLFVTYIWTHDSVAIGADGPTHQPIDQLPMLRAIPNFAVIRPADANELSSIWECILEKQKPTGLVLSRQDLHVIHSDLITKENVSRGAYILENSFDPDNPDIIIIATGSEVGVALAFHKELNSEEIGIRVVSMPCMDWFDLQPREYQEKVLPSNCEKRISLEAGSTFGWDRYVGPKGVKIGIDQFGASGDGDKLMSRLGISLKGLEKGLNKLLNKEIRTFDI
jgi:transketolase